MKPLLLFPCFCPVILFGCCVQYLGVLLVNIDELNMQIIIY
jgi:hypothetical protein